MRRGECVRWPIPLCGDTSGARAYERDCERSGGTRARLTRCHGRRRRGARRGRAAARSAVRRCAWARRSAGTATTPWCGGDGRFGRRRRGDGEGLTTLGELARATARGEEAEVADADEALRQDVQEKASEKFVDVERERADLTPVAIVLPPKRDGVVGDGDEPVIRDGDAVGVSREVVQHVGGTAEGRLGVDHPRLAIERSEKRAKGRRRSPAAARLPGKCEAAVRETRRAGRRRACPERPAAAPASGGRSAAARGSTACHPATSRPPARRSGRGDDAAAVWPHVWRTISPPMAAPRRFGFAATWSRSPAARLKQQVVHHALVDEREARERLRHREDDVDVADRQQLLLARRHPRVRARAVRHFGQCRSRQLLYERAGCAHCSQRSRCPPSAAVRHCAMARRTRRCCPVTQARCVSRKRSPCWRTMSATSKGGRVTACAAGASGAPCPVPETGIASSGLATACRCRCDRCR